MNNMGECRISGSFGWWFCDYLYNPPPYQKMQLFVRLRFAFRTIEQESFITNLPQLKMSHDEEVIESLRYVYKRRVKVLRCSNFWRIVKKFQVLLTNWSRFYWRGRNVQ